jgi:hypothetical protein
MELEYCTPNSKTSSNEINTIRGCRREQLGDITQPGGEEGRIGLGYRLSRYGLEFTL